MQPLCFKVSLCVVALFAIVCILFEATSNVEATFAINIWKHRYPFFGGWHGYGYPIYGGYGGYGYGGIGIGGIGGGGYGYGKR